MTSHPPSVLTRSALRDFAECPRRFHLRYVDRLPWPNSPPDEPTAVSLSRGQQFHRLLERHFLGLPVEESAIGDEVVRGWWSAFLRNGPPLPEGRRWAEHELTIPAGDFFLNGRFDLLIVTEMDGQPAAQLLDWKTSRPRPVEHLQRDWQTRLYLAMLAESGTALTGGTRPLVPGNLAMTYWYASDPDQPRTIRYNAAAHTENWAEIRDLLARLTEQFNEGAWPLTQNLDHCRACAYQVYCGRQAGEIATPLEEDEPALLKDPDAFYLEPRTP